MAYAEKTTVAPEKSRLEIENLLNKHGATGFGYVSRETEASVAFEMKDRSIRFKVSWAHSYTGHPARVAAAADQRKRQRWRALLLCIKAKLETVESGIETFEEAFLAHVVIPGSGLTVYEQTHAQIKDAYIAGPEGGRRQLMLEGPR